MGQTEKAQVGLRNARLARIQTAVKGMLSVKRKSLEKAEAAAQDAEAAASEFAEQLAMAEAKAAPKGKPKVKAKAGGKLKAKAGGKLKAKPVDHGSIGRELPW